MRAPTLSLAGVAVVASTASATVLTFDPHPGNGRVINQAYGDRVFKRLQGGFAYGTGRGRTPNVEVSYSPSGQTRHWDLGYGDLENVLYRAHTSPGVLDLRFQADPGYLVTLSGFDLASWETGSTISRLDVLDSDGPLFTMLNVNIDGGAAHTSFDFPRPLVGDVLIIRVNAENLGPLSERIAIDNVAFGQYVPAPGAAGALLGLLLARRRR